MEIRKAEEKDAEEIRKLLEGYPVPMGEVKKNIAAGTAYLAEREGNIVGFADGKIQGEGKDAYGRILHFLVKKEFRGRGIATELLEMLKKEFRNRGIERVSVECAIMGKKE
ncbi:GNAT family N-acetyltransferase [Candidatus Micrarchaeota archaeon]|nr:GNAT family N-acetyltransferase [Candidatus Micrarchaeota archaeon]MBD3418119.1 GNAT family N-acetyltransferase [Candidatus Micrarchaeota archaeon]